MEKKENILQLLRDILILVVAIAHYFNREYPQAIFWVLVIIMNQVRDIKLKE